MKQIVKLLLMNIVVFFISMLFMIILLTIHYGKPLNADEYKVLFHDAIRISYAFCGVFTISFFFLSTGPMQELFDAIER